MIDAGTHASRTVLVVEDDPLVRKLTCSLLEDTGYRAFGAAGVESALRLVSSPCEAPDLVVVDYRLGPGMDGTELVGELRRRLGREIPALVTSGDPFGEPPCRAREARCFFLGKPFMLEDLLDKLSEIGAVTDADSRDGGGFLPASTDGS